MRDETHCEVCPHGDHYVITLGRVEDVVALSHKGRHPLIHIVVHQTRIILTMSKCQLM